MSTRWRTRGVVGDAAQHEVGRLQVAVHVRHLVLAATAGRCTQARLLCARLVPLQTVHKERASRGGVCPCMAENGVHMQRLTGRCQ